MPQAVQRGAPLRRRRKLCFWTACFCNPPVFAVTAPLPKKSLLCKSFSGARNSPLFLISVGFSYETCAWLGARERSERVTRAAQPPSSAPPPTCIKTVTYFYGHFSKRRNLIHYSIKPNIPIDIGLVANHLNNLTPATLKLKEMIFDYVLCVIDRNGTGR